MKMNSLAIPLLTTLWVCQSPCYAEFRPTFHFEPSAWSASDVVVASEGDEIDGNLTVLEAWKGTLERGDVLSIPELADFKDAEQRLVQSIRGLTMPVPESPHVVSGQRMILFLKRKADLSAGAEPNGSPWEPASAAWGMRASVVWVESGRTYAFTQVFNPGPSLLLDQNKPEVEMKREVSEMAETQKALLAITKVQDSASRAAQSYRFAEREPFYGQWEAFNILAGCGQDGVLALVDVLNRHERRAKYYHEIVRAIAVAAGAQADDLFTEMVREETAFLKDRVPTLPKEWWGEGGLNAPEAGEFSSHYSKTTCVLYQLQHTSSPDSREAVSQLKHFLDLHRHPDEWSWVNHLSKACDGVLTTAGDKSKPPQ